MSVASQLDLLRTDQGETPLRSRAAERASGTSHSAFRLVFDSLRDAAPTGHRGSHLGDRHLVYMSHDYALGLHLEPREHDSDILRGELLSRGEGPVAEVPTFLLDGDEIAGYACTGSLGEFRLETAGATDLRLCLLLDAQRCIDLPIELEPVAATAGKS